MFFGGKDLATGKALLSKLIRSAVSQTGRVQVPASPGKCAMLAADKSVAKP